MCAFKLLVGVWQPRSSPDLVFTCRRWLQRARVHFDISFSHVEGHSGNPGNEEADRGAKLGADGSLLSWPLMPTTSLLIDDELATGPDVPCSSYLSLLTASVEATVGRGRPPQKGAPYTTQDLQVIAQRNDGITSKLQVLHECQDPDRIRALKK
eukprot:6449039-Pyramimonas_sp.AAC.1